MKKLVSVIIVNWNGKHYLKDCLPTLYKQHYKNIEVILVDNGSKDGSIAYTKEYYPKTKIIENTQNLGFAEANNQGVTIATGQYLLFLNNDTKVSKDFITELVKAIEKDKKLGLVQSKILLMDEPDHLDSVAGYLTPTGFLYHYGVNKKDSDKYDKGIEMYSAKGACMLIKSSVAKKILVDKEFFDNDYFAYFEETDMCHRVWLAGYKISFVPTSTILHKMGGTSTKLDNAFVQYHSYKNRIRSHIKNLSGSNLFTILTLHIIVCIGYSFVYLVRGKFSLFITIYRAMYWNIKVLPETLRKRKYIQNNIRKVSDTEIFPIIMKHPRLSYYYHITKGLHDYED